MKKEGTTADRAGSGGLAHPLRWWHWPLLAALIIGTVYCALEYNGRLPGEPSDEAATFQHDAGSIFGTVYHISYAYPHSLQEGIDSLLECLDNSLSPFNPHSNISAINAAEHTAIADSFLLPVLILAQAIAADTDGAFDITVAPLVNAWGFGFEDMDEPGEALIDSLRQFVGYQRLTLRGDTVVKDDARLLLNCSAIAKGYAVDRVAEWLAWQGVESYMVEIGGEIRLHGHNPDGEPWHIGVNAPRDDGDIATVLTLTDAAIATSGNYRNHHEAAGRDVGHTIDPRTGEPALSALRSATVLAPTCAQADAYATAFMVVGLAESQAILRRHPEMQAVLIHADEHGNELVWRTDSIAETE